MIPVHWDSVHCIYQTIFFYERYSGELDTTIVFPTRKNLAADLLTAFSAMNHSKLDIFKVQNKAKIRTYFCQ